MSDRTDPSPDTPAKRSATTPEGAPLIHAADLPPAAQRALAEAEERRRAAEGKADLPPELGGRKDGLEPVRYGDWEKKGIAIDF